jgi:tripartite-type tricarboxylate transporter receptor subunit TctC
MTIARSSPATDACHLFPKAVNRKEHSMPLIDRRVVSLLGVAAILSPLGALAAETYPSRPIHLIVGFTAGASSDVIARIFAKAADPLLGQQVVVENKPGAGSSIAAEYVARSVNDGYTLFVPTLSTLTDEIVNPNRSTHLGKDFCNCPTWQHCHRPNCRSQR